AHAVLRHHAARDVGRVLDILRRTGRDLLRAEYQLLGDAPPVGHGEARQDGLLRVLVELLLGEVRRNPERATARNDRDLVQGVRAREVERHQRVSTRRICSRPFTSGMSTTIWRSNRPGRKSAGSRMSGRFVAARRMTPSFDSKPSISTSSWLSVCSRSSCPPPSPAPRCRPTASISSMNTMQFFTIVLFAMKL